MSYENEIKHLMRELKLAKSDYLNARLKSEDALRIHAFKTDVETIEFQIEVFEKAAKADEYEAKAKAWDKLMVEIDRINEEATVKGLPPKTTLVTKVIAVTMAKKEYESGESE